MMLAGMMAMMMLVMTTNRETSKLGDARVVRVLFLCDGGADGSKDHPARRSKHLPAGWSFDPGSRQL